MDWIKMGVYFPQQVGVGQLFGGKMFVVRFWRNNAQFIGVLEYWIIMCVDRL